MTARDPADRALGALRAELRARGLRWTPQRRTIVQVITEAPDHLTGAELVGRCRAVDPDTTPSTVYRTLEVLESVGRVRHSHGLDGREEYHVRAGPHHAHLLCSSCGSRAELAAPEAVRLASSVEDMYGFEVDLAHLSLVGRCAACRAEDQLSSVGRDRATTEKS